MSWIPAALGLVGGLLGGRAKVKRSRGQIIGEEAADRLLGLDTSTDWDGDVNRYFDAALRISKETFERTLAVRDATYTAQVGGNPYLAGADSNTALQNAAFGSALIAPNELARAEAMLGIPERRAGILSQAASAGSASAGAENTRRQQEAALQQQQAQAWGSAVQYAASQIPGLNRTANTAGGGNGGSNAAQYDDGVTGVPGPNQVSYMPGSLAYG